MKTKSIKLKEIDELFEKSNCKYLKTEKVLCPSGLKAQIYSLFISRVVFEFVAVWWYEGTKKSSFSILMKK